MYKKIFQHALPYLAILGTIALAQVCNYWQIHAGYFNEVDAIVSATLIGAIMSGLILAGCVARFRIARYPWRIWIRPHVVRPAFLMGTLIAANVVVLEIALRHMPVTGVAGLGMVFSECAAAFIWVIKKQGTIHEPPHNRGKLTDTLHKVKWPIVSLCGVVPLIELQVESMAVTIAVVAIGSLIYHIRLVHYENLGDEERLAYTGLLRLPFLVVILGSFSPALKRAGEINIENQVICVVVAISGTIAWFIYQFSWSRGVESAEQSMISPMRLAVTAVVAHAAGQRLNPLDIFGVCAICVGAVAFSLSRERERERERRQEREEGN